MEEMNNGATAAEISQEANVPKPAAMLRTMQANLNARVPPIMKGNALKVYDGQMAKELGRPATRDEVMGILTAAAGPSQGHIMSRIGNGPLRAARIKNSSLADLVKVLSSKGKLKGWFDMKKCQRGLQYRLQHCFSRGACSDAQSAFCGLAQNQRRGREPLVRERRSLMLFVLKRLPLVLPLLMLRLMPIWVVSNSAPRFGSCLRLLSATAVFGRDVSQIASSCVRAGLWCLISMRKNFKKGKGRQTGTLVYSCLP